MPEEQSIHKIVLPLIRSHGRQAGCERYRTPVTRIVAHLTNNPDLTGLFAAYPELMVADVKVCLQLQTVPPEEVI